MSKVNSIRKATTSRAKPPHTFETKQENLHAVIRKGDGIVNEDSQPIKTKESNNPSADSDSAPPPQHEKP